MNKSDLIGQVAVLTSKDKKDVELIFNTIINRIKETVKVEDVKIAGFGTFKTEIRKERQGVNPKTLEKITIPEKTVVKFKLLKDF